MKPWVKRHPYVALALLVLLFPAILAWHLAEHVPEALRDWLYEWRVIWNHAKGTDAQAH